MTPSGTVCKPILTKESANAKTPIPQVKIKRKGLAPHWYFITYYECVMGDRHSQIRERRFDPKPFDWDKRHEVKEVVCSHHYL